MTVPVSLPPGPRTMSNNGDAAATDLSSIGKSMADSWAAVHGRAGRPILSCRRGPIGDLDDFPFRICVNAVEDFHGPRRTVRR